VGQARFDAGPVVRSDSPWRADPHDDAPANPADSRIILAQRERCKPGVRQPRG